MGTASWRTRWACGTTAAVIALAGCVPREPVGLSGWLSWRGPGQDGTSPEKGLPQRWQPAGENHLWDVPLNGRGAPVAAAGGHLYCIEGAGPAAEALQCLDAKLGKTLWRRELEAQSGWLNPQRAARGYASPAIDPDTGAVFALGAGGLFAAFSPEGEPLWRRALAEEFGWMASLQGAASPAVDGDLVIVHGLMAGSGGEPGLRDRFLAFEKRSGDLVWSQSPGPATRESSVSSPVFEWRASRRFLYAGTGCGHLVALDARTGEILWLKHLSPGPAHASPLLVAPDLLVAIALEDREASRVETLLALRLPANPAPGTEPPAAWTSQSARIDTQAAAARAISWSVPAASPVWGLGHVWHRGLDGIARAFDPATGRQVRQVKLGGASPAAAPSCGDGMLYAPVGRNEFALAPLAEGAPAPPKVALDGTATGAPAIFDGRVFVLTTRRMYCFGSRRGNPAGAAPWPRSGLPGDTGSPARLQAAPAEVLLSPGGYRRLRLRALDAKGNLYADAVRATWRSAGSPSPVQISEEGEVVATAGAAPWAGAFEADSGGVKGQVRVRLLPAGAYREDFEHLPPAAGQQAPEFWLAPAPTWRVRDAGGHKVLAATVASGERWTAFFGHPQSSGGTLATDVMIEPVLRPAGRLGIVFHRYAAALDANWQRIEIEGTGRESLPSAPFAWQPGTWYRFRMSVEIQPGGAAFVRARAWPRDQPEPHTWNLEALDVSAQTEGAPGLFAEGSAPLDQGFLFDNIELLASP